MTQFLVNTVLLEKNRWQTVQHPSILVSDWMDAIQSDGFDGIELWANHALKASDEEVNALSAHPLPIEIFNSYVSFEDSHERERAEVASIIQQLSPKQVKFNLGPSEALIDTYIENLKQWKDQLPEGCQLLCECHPGTVMEDPKKAKDLFSHLGNMNCKAIIHPFHENTDLHTWFHHLGDRIAHAHVSLYKGGSFYALEEAMEWSKDRVKDLKTHGYKGSFSMEFTKGTATEEETPEKIYAQALRDFSFLKKQLQEQEV